MVCLLVIPHSLADIAGLYLEDLTADDGAKLRSINMISRNMIGIYVYEVMPITHTR